MFIMSHDQVFGVTMTWYSFLLIDEITKAWSSALLTKLGVNGAHFFRLSTVIPVVPPVTCILWISFDLYINSASVDNDCGHSGQKILFEDKSDAKLFIFGL